MSRHGYTDGDDDDSLAMGRWRGRVASTIRGKRGQAFLIEVLAALDAIPTKRLISQELRSVGGEFCTLGAVGAVRGIDLAGTDPEDYDQVANLFGILPVMAQEIMWANDELVYDFEWIEIPICGPMRQWERPFRSLRIPTKDVEEKRWQTMHDWVSQRIKNTKATA